MTKKEQLQKLLEIKKSKANTTPRPISMFSINSNMPHDRKVEIGRRVLKEKILDMRS